MKLLGFEGHEILSMSYEIITEKALQQMINENSWNKEESGEANVYMTEEISIKMTSQLNKVQVQGKILVVEVEGFRKIFIDIVGDFTIDNEGETDPRKVSDEVFKELWPMLRKYVNPAISTITSITTLGELNLEK